MEDGKPRFLCTVEYCYSVVIQKGVNPTMENKYSEHVYSKKDIDKAYIIGLESAVFVLEKSIGLSPEGQREMLESLKEMVQKEKVSVTMSK